MLNNQITKAVNNALNNNIMVEDEKNSNNEALALVLVVLILLLLNFVFGPTFE